MSGRKKSASACQVPRCRAKAEITVGARRVCAGHVKEAIKEFDRNAPHALGASEVASAPSIGVFTVDCGVEILIKPHKGQTTKIHLNDHNAQLLERLLSQANAVRSQVKETIQ